MGAFKLIYTLAMVVGQIYARLELLYPITGTDRYALIKPDDVSYLPFFIIPFVFLALPCTLAACFLGIYEVDPGTITLIAFGLFFAPAGLNLCWCEFLLFFDRRMMPRE